MNCGPLLAVHAKQALEMVNVSTRSGQSNLKSNTFLGLIRQGCDQLRSLVRVVSPNVSNDEILAVCPRLGLEQFGVDVHGGEPHLSARAGKPRHRICEDVSIDALHKMELP